MNWHRFLARLVLPFALALACGDDGNDDTGNDDTGNDDTGNDTAAGSTFEASTSAGAETTDAAATGSSDGGDSTTGFPAECEGLCADGEICVALGLCSSYPPLCRPAADVVCDFEGNCGVMDVCTGTFVEGALLCETCS